MADATPKHENHDLNSLYHDLPHFPSSHSQLLPSPPIAQNGSSTIETPRSGSRKETDSLSGLRALPEVRPVPWAVGKELPIEKSTESPRTQTQGAFLLSTRGNVNIDPCSHCATGAGRFALCINHPSWFQGVCATCQMATRGNLCTLRVISIGKYFSA